MQKVDPARTLAARLAPKLEADRLIGLYAFNYEIARVAETVSDATLGEIRLQWWREAIEEIRDGKKVRAHDAAESLERALKGRQYPFDLLLQLVDARERDLDEAPFNSVDELAAYAEATAGKLALAAAHSQTAAPIATIVQSGLLRAGQAWGLAGLAREQSLAKQFNARPRLPMTPSADEIAAAARQAHKDARSMLRGAPAEILPAYAYAALVPSLTRSFSVQAASPLGMRWRILRAAITGGV
ncbi:MAG: squalene/phytoene synthase family protein [Caulobacterales bacterium]